MRAVFRSMVAACGLRELRQTATRSELDGASPPVCWASRRAVEPEGDLLHRQLPQLRQLLRREEVVHGRLDPLAGIDLSGLQPLAEVFRRKVDVDDLVGHRDHVVGQPLFDANARGPLHDVVQALQVLDVERGDDADARSQQFFDVEVAFRIAAAGRVGVGQFVDQGDGRAAGQDGVEVHLLEQDPAILDLAARHLFEFADLRHGLGPAVGFHEADHHVNALLSQAVSLLQHLEGLAHPGGKPQVDLQLAALLAADEVQEPLGIGMHVVARHGSAPG